MAAQQQQQQQTPPRQAPPPVPDEVKRLEGMLNGMTKDFEAALPAAAKARVGDFLRMALIDVPRQRGLVELAKANPARILIALMDIARLGLFPGSKLGEAWVVPFAVGQGQDRRPDCQAIIGYQGFLKLARNSGLIESVQARAVYAGDRFEIQFGLHEDIVHVPGADVDRSYAGNVLGCYTVCKFKGGGHHIEWMTADEILAIARRSKTYDRRSDSWSGPWQTDWIEMAKKTVIRRAAKQWPKSVDMAEAVALDERNEIVVEAEEVTRPALGHTKSHIFDLGAFADAEPEPAPAVAAEPAQQHVASSAAPAPAPAQPRQRRQAAAAAPALAPQSATKPADPPPPGTEGPAQLTAAEKAEIVRQEREEAEREAAARDRARGDS